MFVQPITRIGVHELVSHGVSTLLLLLFGSPPRLFFPYLCVSLFAGVSVSTQHSKICSGGLIPLQKCFICHDRFVQKNKKKTQCLYHNGKLGAALYTLKSVEEKTRTGKLMLNNLYMLLSVLFGFVAGLQLFLFNLIFSKKSPVGV